MFARWITRWCLVFLVFYVEFGPAAAHPPDKHRERKPTATDTHTDTHSPPSALLLPPLFGPKPWTDKPTLNDPSRFHFAIMTDRTGGHRPGIWMQGVRTLNLMRPEFVVSIGDLIEGYTTDEKIVKAEWQEFEGFVNQLDSKFFFVAGNHDVTNAMMHRLWRERFGPEWYSFDYKDVHFLCLSSEDPESRIGEEQLAWIRDDLKTHADARWTLVFLHKPLWAYAERELAAGNQDSTNWKQVEELLAERPHNVFAGHHHQYVQFDRRGTQYYQLATTGGGSRLRGQPYGEFDHVVWVTMEKEGPHIANLRLDGVLPADVTTERSIQRFRKFLATSLIEIAPILIESGGELAEGVVRIRLTNEFDDDIELVGKIAGLPFRGLTVDSLDLMLSAAAGSSQMVDFRFRLVEPIPLEQFARTTLTATLRSMGDDPLTAEITVPVTIAQRYTCPRLDIAVDGKLDDWTSREFATPDDPRIIGAAQQWQGPTDGSVKFRVAHNDDHLLLSGRVIDDALIPNQDSLFFFIDPRKLTDRTRVSGQHNVSSYLYGFNIDLSKGVDQALIRVRRPGRPRQLDDTRFAAVAKENGYDFEIALPIQFITDSQGEDWSSFQLNCGLKDSDEPSDAHCMIPWRGSHQVGRSTAHYAHFFRDE